MNVSHNASSNYRERVSRVVAHMQANLRDDLSLDALAKVACFSPYHFQRVFKAMTGESPSEFVKRVRLEKAANMLAASSAPITDIAMECGFSSPSVLSREFKLRFGMAPVTWRRTTAREAKDADVVIRFIPDDADWSGASIERRPAIRVAAVTCFEGYGRGIAKAYAALYRWAGAKGLLSDRPIAMGIPWDNPSITHATKCRYSACLEIPATAEAPSGPVAAFEFPARDYLEVPYEGPIAGLGAAYESLYGRYLPASGREPADDPVLERYARNDGTTIAVTLCLPLA
jgi:AraC family transcriptional regulator